VLNDLQFRLDDGWSEYSHYVMRATNAAGVSEISQVKIDFDPELDRLFLHAVALRRGNETIDELQHGRIEVLQRESGLENGILDGWKTFHLVMSDVRIGDSIDYSFTIEHRDPSWGNRFFGRILTQWSDPVSRSRVRILTRTQAPIYLRYPQHQEPTRADDGAWQTLEWNATDIPGIAQQKGTPSWYEQYPVIQVSQFGSWKELVDAALPLYALPAAPSQQLAAVEKRLSSSARSDPERALAVVRFVQEEIRYTGLELGSGAYRPTPPSEVLKRRYGDCKDKTLLAVALLRDLGIDAAAALVSPRWRGHLHELQPSPGDFTHAITRMRIGSRTYWIDMTDTAQGGELDSFVQADFGEALVIAPGVSALEEIPGQRASSPLVSSNVEFDLRAGLDKEASLTVTTVYRGAEADDLRGGLRSQTVAQLGTSYLNYYKGRYASIRALSDPHVADDFRANEITVTEAYRIDRPFEPDDSGKRHFEVEAEIINEHLRSPSTPMRTLPLALESTVDSSERIRVKLPEVFPVKEETVKIAASGFHYESRTSRDGNDVVLDYSYRTLSDSVPPEAMEEFLRKRAQAQNDTYFRFTKNADEKHQPSAKVAEAAELLLRAARLAQGGQVEKSDDVLKQLFSSEGFQSLTAEQQHAALVLAGAVALVSDPERSLGLLTRASGMDKATSADWMLRLQAATQAQNRADATLSLITLAQSWPQALSDIDSTLVARTVASTPNADPSRYKLLSALFEAKYEAENLDPSGWWRDLALLQLQHGEQPAAAKSLASLTDAYTLIGVRADNRFAPIRGSASLDISVAVERQIQAARERVKGHPAKLQPLLQLLDLLVQSLHFDEALQIADEAISATIGPKGSKVYDDYPRVGVWLLNSRSRALQGLGRWDEAVTQLQAASRLPEGGNANVSQVINLAELYNDLGKPTEARAMLAGLSENLSPYGHMAATDERLRSAVQLGDVAEAERQLDFLREHRDDSLKGYQRALVSMNRLDEAARLLISRLQNPDQRLDALMEVQQYQEYRSSPMRLVEWNRRWQDLCARSDVRSAITKVGKIGAYPLMAR
jgi:transglutaminase-like putative cysteine protease/tetratricopeptide (TPR) repeat protein